MVVSIGDGWGGKMLAAMRTELAASAATLGLDASGSVVGRTFQAKGEYTIRAAGAFEVDGDGPSSTADMEMFFMREGVEFTACVQAGEDAGDTPLNLLPIAERMAIALLNGGWLDPQIDLREDVSYTQEAEKELLAESGFTITGRCTVALDYNRQ